VRVGAGLAPHPTWTPEDRAGALVEALPYIRRFRNRVIVLKCGGYGLTDAHLAQTFADDVALLHSVGVRPVVVHGGGPQIGELMVRLGMEPSFRDGHRVTDAATLEVARMVLVGKVNRDVVTSINVHGPLAVGVSGEDAGLIVATPRHPGLGFVGDVDTVNPGILERLLADDLVPVVSTIGADEAGQAYNINADVVAGAVAEALGAEKVVFLTDVAGVLGDVDDTTTLVRRITPDGLRRAIADGIVAGGMMPKATACVRAVEHGVGSAHIVDGHVPHAVLLELLTDEGVGTMVSLETTSTSGPVGAGATIPPVTAPAPIGPPDPAGAPAPTNVLMGTYAPAPVTFVRGTGTCLWDRGGRRYLDFVSGLAVTSLGHSHPAIAEAIATQARTLLHVSNLFGTEPGVDVAGTLDRLLGGGGRVFFCNSGAEANECAIKLARKWAGPGRHEVVSAYGSFHGRTLATLHATGQPAKHEPFQPLPAGFRHVPWLDLDALAAAIGPEVAAVLLEPVQGEGGVLPATSEYLQGVRELCHERAVLFVVDEVQTGLGRTGRWFAHQHFGVVPDVVTMAKALGNGVPIGACWARADVASAFAPGDHATTFGGQPLAASAARAVLAEMERIDAPSRAARAGARLAERLCALPGVAEVRGLGLLLAVELADGRRADEVAARALAAGLVVNAVSASALRLAPPLTVSDAEVDAAVTILAEVLR
jgi:acetylornithine/N-succinyldiaminopimelate aminotransferase